MGRPAFRPSELDCLSLSTKWLKDHGYFCGSKKGRVVWGENESIVISVETANDPQIRFRYTLPQWGGGKRHIDFAYPLVRIPCNFGGHRWAFRCSFVKNGKVCGRLAHMLYSGHTDYFGCRRCMGILYDSQKASASRFSGLSKCISAWKKIDNLPVKIIRRFYRGRITKRAKRLYGLYASLIPLKALCDFQIDSYSAGRKTR